ncbi:MAG: hypothetical protein HY906_21690 [Deltaproteobacteria bacterium]|nr:hypothetical protein [Deltaproteobacteria bacterium]
MKAAGKGMVAIEVEGRKMTVPVTLAKDRVTFGWRAWLVCGCGCGRRGRYGYLIDGILRTGTCAKKRLTYFMWSWPDSRWRQTVGRPLMAAARGASTSARFQ